MYLELEHAIPDYESLKWRQQAAWASADFGPLGVRLQIVGETLCEAADVRASDNVLDVAAGSGNAALAAARRYADVTAIDYVPDALEQLLARADAEGLSLLTQVADAERLPFADGEFDVAISTFGVMFAPDQERAALELLRVVRPGGRIALASWTPEGFKGELQELLDRFVPRPAGIASPTDWGVEHRLVEWFGKRSSEMRLERKEYNYRFVSAEHWIDSFRRYCGPVREIFDGLDADGRWWIREELIQLLERYDRGGGETLIVPSEYLEAVIRRD